MYQFSSITNDIYHNYQKDIKGSVVVQLNTYLHVFKAHICFILSQSAIEWDIGWNLANGQTTAGYYPQVFECIHAFNTWPVTLNRQNTR